MEVTVNELTKKFHVVCRFCLSDVHCLPIFLSDHSFNDNLNEGFEIIASKVDENDGLPNNICNSCTRCIEDFMRFESKCRKSYEILEAVIPLLHGGKIQHSRKITLKGCENVEGVVKTKNICKSNDVTLTDLYDFSIEIVDNDNQLTKKEVYQDKSEHNIEKKSVVHITDNVEILTLHKNDTLGKRSFLALNYSTPNSHGNGDSGSDASEFAESVNHLSEDQKKIYNEAANTEVKDWVCRSGRRIPIVQCMFCNKTYRGRNTLRKHLKLHFNIKNYTCQYCARSFSDRSSLRLHEFRHSTVKSYHCKHCDRAYYSQAELKQHFVLQHDERKFVCTVCCAKFPSKTMLNDHSRVHMPDRPYVCNLCGYSFKRNRNLTRHILCHNNGNPKGKVNGWQLEKSIRCRHCSLLFEIPTELLEHMIELHSQEYERIRKSMHSCPYCYSTFEDLEKCLNHQNKHFAIPVNTAGGRIYECGECGRQLRYKSLAQKHLLSHSKKEVLKCPYQGCLKKYKHKVHFLRHIREIHESIIQCSEGSANEYSE